MTTKSKPTARPGSTCFDTTENLNDLITDVTGANTAVTELIADHATFVTVTTDVKALVNEVRNLIRYLPLGNPGFAIDTNFDIKNANAISYINGGTLKSLSADTNFDTGTSATIAGSQWGVAVLSVTSAAAATVTWFTAAGAGYASEAAAIAAISGLTATSTHLGYATVQAHASGFTAGTDALTGGTGGNVATTTTYYNLINPNTLLLGAAVSSSPPATLSAGATTITAEAVGYESGTAI